MNDLKCTFGTTNDTGRWFVIGNYWSIRLLASAVASWFMWKMRYLNQFGGCDGRYDTSRHDIPTHISPILSKDAIDFASLHDIVPKKDWMNDWNLRNVGAVAVLCRATFRTFSHLYLYSRFAILHEKKTERKQKEKKLRKETQGPVKTKPQILKVWSIWSDSFR